MYRQLLRAFFISVALLVIACLVNCTSPASKPNQVLMILREQSEDMEYMVTNEVNVMIKMLETAGIKVVTASVTGQTITVGKTTLVPSIKLSDVKIEDFAGFILPCMAAATDRDNPPEAIEIVKKANAAKKPVAAQMSGVLLLNEAGVLKGKQIAMPEQYQILFSDSIYKGEGVIQDGNIITSGICPFMGRIMSKKDGTTELTEKLIDMLISAR